MHFFSLFLALFLSLSVSLCSPGRKTSCLSPISRQNFIEIYRKATVSPFFFWCFSNHFSFSQGKFILLISALHLRRKKNPPATTSFALKSEMKIIFYRELIANETIFMLTVLMLARLAGWLA